MKCMQWLNHACRFKGFVRDKEVQHDAGLDRVLVQGLYAPFSLEAKVRL